MSSAAAIPGLSYLILEGRNAIGGTCRVCSMFRRFKTNTAVEPFIDVMSSTAHRIGAEVPDTETHRLFASIGLSPRS